MMVDGKPEIILADEQKKLGEEGKEWKTRKNCKISIKRSM